MNAQSASLRNSVLTVLNEIPDSVNFEINGFIVSPANLQAVRTAILAQSIKIEYDQSLGDAMCAYLPKTDTLQAGFLSAKDLPQKAILLHEAVHAWMDMCSFAGPISTKRWKVVESETAAYIAQVIYIRIKGPGARLTAADAETDKIFAAAWDIAMKKKPEFEKLDAVVEPVKKAVEAHALYKKKAQQPTDHDGVQMCISAHECVRDDD